MTSLLIPLEGFAHHGGPPGAESFLPFLGVPLLILTVLLVLGALAFLRRGGQLNQLSFLRRPSPEHDARAILADRFARGDISSDEFLERASILNWTPGSDAYPARPGRKKRR
ncbi:MAG: hypothetical protein JWP61_1548 [Friedmanniella sp.]|jgi:putative membrane protein|nr:hypothetical protein [Friedmanniella sp.]